MKKILITLIALIAFGFSLDQNYITGAKVAYSTTKAITIGTTNVVSRIRDSQNVWDIVYTNALTVNIDTSGIDGIDTGTVAPWKIYYVWLVARKNRPYTNVRAMISLSPTTPTLPTNSVGNYIWNVYRCVGSIYTVMSNSTAVTNVCPFVQSGSGSIRQTALFCGTTNLRMVYLGGTNTDLADGYVSLTNYVSFKAVSAKMIANVTSTSTNGQTVYVTSGTALDTATPLWNLNVMATNVPCINYNIPFDLPLSVPAFRYAVDAGTFANFQVLGYTEEF